MLLFCFYSKGFLSTHLMCLILFDCLLEFIIDLALKVLSDVFGTEVQEDKELVLKGEGSSGNEKNQYFHEQNDALYLLTLW